MGIVQTSVPGLDPLIGGGLPSGSLTVLIGEPGSGKTNLAARFVYGGARAGEKVLYASLCEDREAFFDNMLRFDLDFETLERKGNFAFLNLVTTREGGVAETLETIIQKISDMEATRLVLDSFTALTAGFSALDSRIIAHSILRRVAKSEGCTSILISESPPEGSSNPEEFVAGNIIRLKRRDIGELSLRELLVEKARSAEVHDKKWLFTLHGGFRVFSSVKPPVLEKRAKYKALMDGEAHFSTGSEDLDRLLGGGFPKGSAVLYETPAGAAFIAGYRGISHLIPWLNFIIQGRGVLIRPPEWLDVYSIKEVLTEFIDEEEFAKYVRILQTHDQPSSVPHVVSLRRNPKENFDDWRNAAEELRRSTGDKPILKWTGVDRLEHLFDQRTVIDHLRQGTIHTQRMGDVIIRRVPTDYGTVNTLARMSTVHLRFEYVNGVRLIYGVKPRFGPHQTEIDVSAGYPQLKLTPMT